MTLIEIVEKSITEFDASSDWYKEFFAHHRKDLVSCLEFLKEIAE
jgi:hypothetical protein